MSEQSAVLEEPRLEVSEPVKQQHPAHSNNLAEHLSYKNRLQEHTQKSGIPLPRYQTINEGDQHAPRFRSSVLVDGAYYTTPNTFLNRKAAEQDVARVALHDVTQKIKDEGCTLVHKDTMITIFSKSILNEYAVKMNLEKPIYTTIPTEGLLPVFTSSLVFNGVTFTGEAGRNKKEAEQLAARAVILSILGISDSGPVISEIIKSKFRLYAAVHKVKDSNNTQNCFMPVAVDTETSLGFPPSKGKEVKVTGCTDNMPISAISEPSSGQLNNMPATNQPFQELKKPKLVSSPEAITPPIAIVPSVHEQPLGIGSSSARKRSRKKKKAKRKARVDAQFPVEVLL